MKRAVPVHKATWMQTGQRQLPSLPGLPDARAESFFSSVPSSATQSPLAAIRSPLTAVRSQLARSASPSSHRPSHDALHLDSTILPTSPEAKEEVKTARQKRNLVMKRVGEPVEGGHSEWLGEVFSRPAPPSYGLHMYKLQILNPQPCASNPQP